MEYINTYNKLRERLDELSVYKNQVQVMRMLDIAREIYSKKLDKMHQGELLRLGGELASLYVYFGQQNAEARAEHEISENVYKQALQLKQQEYMVENEGYKVTEAKNLALKDLGEFLYDVIVKEAAHKQWENVMDTSKTLIMFIQSALSTKKSESYVSSGLHNN